MKVTVCYDLMFDVEIPDKYIREAQTIRDHLQRGTAFNELAREHSEFVLAALDAADDGEITAVYNPETDEALWEG